MSVILQRETQNTLEGKSFYNRHLPTALREAQEHAGEDGFVATMPQLLHGRVVAPKSNEIWTKWYTAQSEEHVGKTKYGCTLFAAVHGRGILTPDRIQQAYDQGLTRQYAARLTEKEFNDLLGGNLPDGTSLPVFSFDEAKDGVEVDHYVVVMPFEDVQKTKSDYQKISELKDNPLFIVRCGGRQQANAYLDRTAKVWNTSKLGNWHSFNNTNLEEGPVGRLLFLGDDDYGLLGGNCLDDDGRFVSVAPETLIARDIEGSEEPKLVAPTLEQVLAVSRDSVSKDSWESFEARVSELYK